MFGMMMIIKRSLATMNLMDKKKINYAYKIHGEAPNHQPTPNQTAKTMSLENSMCHIFFWKSAFVQQC
jgi:hypothetical protein